MVTAQDFSGLPNLDTLDLSKNSLNDESFVSNSLSLLMCLYNLIQNLTLLKNLDLGNNQLSDVPALPPSLEVLKMNTNELGALGPHCFTGLVNLLNLELLGNTLHEAAVSPSAFRALENLLSLQVDQNHFTSVPLGLPRSLQMLKMSGNMIDSVTEEALRGCSNLRLLDLSGNQLHEQSIPANAWTHLKSLEALDLSSNQLESVPANLPRRLRKLTLRNNNIGHVPAVSFRHLRPGLQSLQLSHNRLGDGSADRASFV
ncbi:unnamed protein product, partial [Tetraodon nigroviridis]